MPITASDTPARNLHAHCPIDALNETCEKFFQIWSHKAANLSNDLIEYTIRRMQSDRLRFLFRTRNELAQRENVPPICQLSINAEDELRRIKEYIRRFCLTTRNVYRHLRSDSRIYPKMCIELDQGIMVKICRFIFKTKVLIEILSKGKHLHEQQREKSKTNEIKQFELNDPYRNITKAFIILQSNFEILFGDVLEKDFFQNAKTAVQTLPIILDTSKTIRLIFCALYQLSEPERRAEAEALRQRRQTICERGYGSGKTGVVSASKKFKTINDMLTINQPPLTNNSTLTRSKTVSNRKSTRPTQSSKSKLNSPNATSSKTSKKRPSSASEQGSKNVSKKSSTSGQKKMRSPRSTSNSEKKPKKKNQNASTTPSTGAMPLNQASSTNNNNDLQVTLLFDQTQPYRQTKFGWTTWLHNATLNLPTTLLSNQTNDAALSKPVLTTWASMERPSKT